jgi:hypothetical protein
MKKFKQVFDEAFLKGKGKCKSQKVFKFTWGYCETCDCMFVRCPKCGNNCCNAGFGRVTMTGLPTNKYGKGTKPCDVCNLAYMYQELADKTNSTPKHEK